MLPWWALHPKALFWELLVVTNVGWALIFEHTKVGIGIGFFIKSYWFCLRVKTKQNI
jgi:hypothetical protein